MTTSPFDLTGRVAIVTGGNGGIGLGMARGLAEAGAAVAIVGRNAAKSDAAVAELKQRGAKAISVIADVTDKTAVAAMVERTKNEFGRIDILVNNAGISQRSLLKDTEMSVYRRIMELDFFAPVALTRAVLPGMRSRGAGHIVMIGSVVSKIGVPLRTGYSAAKHAIAGFTEAAAAELWRDGVKFTLACPGFVRTQVSVNALGASGEKHGVVDEDIGKGLSPERCADAIWRAVAKDREEVLIAGREGLYVLLKRFAPSLFSYALKRAKSG